MGNVLDKTYQDFKRVYPESGEAISLVARAIHAYMRDTIGVTRFDDNAHTFLNDSLWQRNIDTHPLGKKYAELTSLDKYGDLLSVFAKAYAGMDQEDQYQVIEGIASDEEYKAEQLEAEIKYNLKMALVGLGGYAQEEFIDFLMTQKLSTPDGSIKGTSLELMSEIINDAVAFSMLSDDYLAQAHKQKNSLVKVFEKGNPSQLGTLDQTQGISVYPIIVSDMAACVADEIINDVASLAASPKTRNRESTGPNSVFGC